MRHGRGFFVRDVTLSDLKDLFEALLILERSAAALAARRISKEQIRALERINEDFRKAWQKNDFMQVTLQNSRFHRGIYEAAGNTFLNSYLNSLPEPVPAPGLPLLQASQRHPSTWNPTRSIPSGITPG